MVVVDTNILVYAADADSEWHAKSRGWLEERRWRPDAWYVTWPILYEFMRVTTHPRVMRRPWSLTGAWAFVSALLASPGLGILVSTERHAAVAAQLFGEFPSLAGNLIHDTHTAVLMREHGVARICTRTRTSGALLFLRLLNPFEFCPSSRPTKRAAPSRPHPALRAIFSQRQKRKTAQRLENWKLARALRWPYFLRSTTRKSRVRKPSFFSVGLSSGSK